MGSYVYSEKSMRIETHETTANPHSGVEDEVGALD